jgi:hypothetical protein
MSGPNHPRSPLDLKPDPEMLLGNFNSGGLSYGGNKAQPPSPDGLTSSSLVRATEDGFCLSKKVQKLNSTFFFDYTTVETQINFDYIK